MAQAATGEEHYLIPRRVCSDMPTYDYLCEVCGKRFDVLQKMTDDPITVCPACSGHVRRVIHPAGIVFKGSGFYKTDHRDSSSSAMSSSSEKPSDAASETAGASEKGSGESKSSSTTAKEATPAATTTKAAS
jgi:putative FmdB family regulatory protein